MIWPIFMGVAALVAGGVVFIVGFSAGSAIAKENTEYECSQAFLRGRRAERNDQKKEPLL